MDKVPRILNVVIPVAASALDTNILTVEEGAEYEVVEVSEVHTVAGSNGGAVTADLVKCTGTQAPSAGTSVLSAAFDCKSTANTPVKKSTASGLVSSRATRTVKAAERLAINFTGTMTAYEGAVFNVVLLQRRPGTRR